MSAAPQRASSTGRLLYVLPGTYAIMRGQITEAERDYSVFSRLGGTPYSGAAGVGLRRQFGRTIWAVPR
jgi:hypothetical protein